MGTTDIFNHGSGGSALTQVNQNAAALDAGNRNSLHQEGVERRAVAQLAPVRVHKTPCNLAVAGRPVIQA
jgi:hypothetical protein